MKQIGNFFQIEQKNWHVCKWKCRQCQNSEFYGNGKKILGVTLHLENKCCKKMEMVEKVLT